jgi:hypothetical protein
MLLMTDGEHIGDINVLKTPIFTGDPSNQKISVSQTPRCDDGLLGEK